MEFTKEARLMIEDEVKGIMGRMALPYEDRAEVEKELRSSYYVRSESKASERGSQAVTVEDVKAACAEDRPPWEIAACYTKLYASNLRRAGFWSRTVAYLIDLAIMGMTIVFVIMPIWIISMLLLFGDNGVVMNHNGLAGGLFILINMAMGVGVLAIILIYSVLCEGRFGKTIGKFVMGLKVLKTDGGRIDYRDAILRNIPKFIGNFIFLDTLVMLIFFGKERQRAFDKVADTIVVHLR